MLRLKGHSPVNATPTAELVKQINAANATRFKARAPLNIAKAETLKPGLGQQPERRDSLLAGLWKMIGRVISALQAWQERPGLNQFPLRCNLGSSWRVNLPGGIQ